MFLFGRGGGFFPRPLPDRVKMGLFVSSRWSLRAQAAEVGGGPDPSPTSAEQHPAQELRLPAGEEAGRGQGPQSPSGEHSGDRDGQAAGETAGCGPAGGHQGMDNSPPSSSEAPRTVTGTKKNHGWGAQNKATLCKTLCKQSNPVSVTLQDMTREQIAAEKVALQKALLYYESIHGRPVRMCKCMSACLFALHMIRRVYLEFHTHSICLWVELQPVAPELSLSSHSSPHSCCIYFLRSRVYIRIIFLSVSQNWPAKKTPYSHK